jgi:MFS family permease
MGVAKLLTALPMGDIADRYGRAPVSRAGSIAYTAATAMTLFAIIVRATKNLSDDVADTNSVIALWAIALCLWGIGKGVVDGPVLALVSIFHYSYFHIFFTALMP